MTTVLCVNSQNGLPHCLHYQEGDGDCCTCGKDLQHCDNCGWAGDARAVTDPSDDANLCPECGDFICASSRTEDCRAEEKGETPCPTEKSSH